MNKQRGGKSKGHILKREAQAMDRTAQDVPVMENGFMDAVGIHAMRWEGNAPVHLHTHDFLEVAMLAKGSCLHSWQGIDVRLVPGDLFVVSPGECHAYQIERETVIYNCLFYPSSLGSDWEKLQAEPALQHLLVLEPFFREETGRQEILHLDRVELERMERLWMDMTHECMEHPMGHAMARKALLMMLLLQIARAWQSSHPTAPFGYDARRNLLAQAIAHIDCHVSDVVSLDALAAGCYVSPGHFRKLFRETTGLSPLEYINHIRMALAQELLRNSELSIADVAAGVGIQDTNYFSRLFRHLVGVAPSTYRKQLQRV